MSRLTAPGEVGSHAAEVGLEPVRRSADRAGTPYVVGSPMYVAIYRKPN
ncbi:hypothetical protein [Streptomyces sp. NPDC050355]|uniref:Uncharacterized protein n=1 Tax=Streptomyces sirii TaxID=3127701 RepID=A0ABZ2QP35_9ACTN